MNILFATNIEYDCDKYTQLMFNCNDINDIYLCNSAQEITEMLDIAEIDLFVVLVKEPNDFGTIAYDLLIENEVDEDRIILLMEKTEGIRKSHLANQVYACDLDQSMFDDIVSYFSTEPEEN